MESPRPIRVMGIDPGTLRMGYAVLEVANPRSPTLLASGVLEASARDSPSCRLGSLFRQLVVVMKQHAPDQVAVESSFFGKNALSMLRLGEARGVALAAAGERNLPATDYSPASVKKAVTGNGSASKQQVAQILSIMLRGLGDVKNLGRLDETDAIAVAWCHVTTVSATARIGLASAAAAAATSAMKATRRPSAIEAGGQRPRRHPHASRSNPQTASGQADALIARWRRRR
ncbi:MAG: crossover junction endodeoxyribonuclease RuvC [Planctomycetes bacterium]|nr:crossover junction endodeoxyribonuclease RuvC [Planctomycetota bacterium]